VDKAETKGETVSLFNTRVLIRAVAAPALGLLMVLPNTLPAGAAGVQTFTPGRALYDVGVHSSVTAAQLEATTASSIRHYTATVKVGSTSYTYAIVGKNPAKKVTNASTTVKVKLIPLIMKFSNGDTWDPTKVDSCDSGATPLSRVQKSPLDVKQAWTWGGTAIGTGQVTDAYQRADFWQYAKPGGVNPTYGVILSVSTLSAVTVNVPDAYAATASIGCGNGLLGATDINWLDPYLQGTVIPSLASKGVSPSTLPIFVLHNFVEYIGTTSQCCVLGYHNDYTAGGGIQTYGLGMYDNSGAFVGSSDISALSHEIAEWQNDPYTTNPTPVWGHIGQVTGCQNNLEVGDPLTGTTFPDVVGGFTYHPQELAFFSWFYHQSPSLGVNGWYSDQGTFTTYAAVCT
jgi:hypothetical protein